MRIGIASSIVLDTIKTSDGTTTISAGGPPCYAGITCRRFGFEVSLVTKLGADMPEEITRLLLREKIELQKKTQAQAPMTKFSIAPDGESRSMVIQAIGTPLDARDIESMNVDCWLVSPVFEEVPVEVLELIKLNGGAKNFVMLDPQGYMRYADSEGNIHLKDRIELDLSRIRAVKVDQRELSALSGGLVGLDGMRALQSRGIEFIVSTFTSEIHLLHKSTQYWAKLGRIDTTDSTGTGDILSAAFCCAYIKEKDPLWALCFGAGAVRAALETRQQGLNKIPSFSKIEENASYFYNTIGFKQLS